MPSTWTKSLIELIRRTSADLPRDVEVLTPALKRQERVIFGLRMAEGIAADIALEYTHALERLRADDLVDLHAGRWQLTARGRNLADYVAVELMR